jgi:glycosyltransferase involved in cell wall biosynthesis
VVALSEGGAAETVIDGETGVLVSERSSEAFADGLRRVDRIGVDTDRLRGHAQQFSRERFLAGFKAVLEEATQ